MEKVTFLHLRRNVPAVIRKVRQGKSLILTYRSKPVMRLESIKNCVIDQDDPLYKISELAAPDGQSVMNEDIDRIVYKA